MFKRRLWGYLFTYIASIFTLGIYHLARLYNDEQTVKRALNKELHLPHFFFQILLSYLTLFLYLYLYVNKVLAKYQSDYLIINRKPFYVSENNFKTKYYVLTLFTIGFYMLRIDYLLYRQNFLVKRVEHTIKVSSREMSLSREDSKSDVVYLKKASKSKKKHLDLADVVYLDKTRWNSLSLFL